MAESESALAGLASGPNSDALRVYERCGLTLLTLRGMAEDPAFADAVADALAPLPRVANTATQAEVATLLWLGPDAWLVATEDAARAEALTTAALTAGGYALDASHARAVIRVEGAAARTVLAQGCALDLHRRAFAVDACVQTRLARVAVLLHLVAGDAFDLYVPRSYGRAVWSWLLR